MGASGQTAIDDIHVLRSGAQSPAEAGEGQATGVWSSVPCGRRKVKRGIQFELKNVSTGPIQQRRSISLHNPLGQLVSPLIDDEELPGYHEVLLDGTALASGVYVYRLRAGETELSRKPGGTVDFAEGERYVTSEYSGTRWLGEHRGEPFWSLIPFPRCRPHLDNVQAQAIPLYACRLHTNTSRSRTGVGKPSSDHDADFPVTETTLPERTVIKRTH